MKNKYEKAGAEAPKPLKNDTSTVKENNNISEQQELLRKAFTILNILMEAALRPHEFTAYTRITKQSPEDKVVMVTADQLIFILKQGRDIEISKEQMEMILESAFSAGTLSSRQKKGDPKMYRLGNYPVGDHRL